MESAQPINDASFDPAARKVGLDALYRLAEHSRSLGSSSHIGHVNTLLVLASCRGMTISALAKEAGMTVAAASRHVQRLKGPPEGEPTGEGFVLVGRASDARVKRIRLSKRGKAWVQAALMILRKSE